jgi:hypothetical protein
MGCSRGSSGTDTAGESMAGGAKEFGVVDSGGMKCIRVGDQGLSCGLKRDRRGLSQGTPHVVMSVRD